MSEASATDIRRAAMDLLARREHSQRELQQKLAQRFPNNAHIAAELERLRCEHLQCDERYAEVFLHSRAQRLYGPQRIRMELRQRGIADEVIERIFSAAAVDWPAMRRQLEESKFGREPANDFKERAKRLRFLQYRGFANVAVGDSEEDL